jgi:hypothetical protein
MKVDVLFSAASEESSYRGRDEDSYDTGRFQFSLVSSPWGGDETMLRGGGFSHDAPHSPDVIVCHSSVFKFDLLRMLRFILWSRKRAPWIIFILLLSNNEKDEMNTLPKQLRDHFSRYFCDIKESFSLDELVETLMMEKRYKYFKKGIVSRRSMDLAIRGIENGKYDFDFAISFAGAQRSEARDIASILNGRGCKVFFDEYETTSILGSNLNEYLYDIYAKKSSYCVLLASKAYVDGPWTRHERRAALDMALKSVDRSYILIIRFDNTELPGVSTSIAYLTWQNNALAVARTLYEKLVLDLLI